MAEEPLSAFHDQLLLFLNGDLQKKKSEEGWDESYDPEMRAYRDLLSRAIRTTAPIPLQEIVERYQHLFGTRGPVHLEHKILEAFPEREMRALGLTPLKMFRGLPRLYQKKLPALSKIKANFSHLPHLLWTAAVKPLFSLYEKQPIPKDVKVALLTYVIPDGLGDLYAAIEAARLIKKGFPQLNLQLFAVSDVELPKVEEFQISQWTGSEEQIDALCGCDLILQMPTHYPEIAALKSQIDARNGLLPKWESLGEYGYIESDWFHPCSFAHCMGLHFLEKGILVRTPQCNSSISELDNDLLVEWLFEQKTPGPQEIESYRKKSRFFLAYLFSYAGIFVYLHSLLKSLEWDAKDIDLCFPDASKIFQYLERRGSEGKELLEKHYKVARIVIQIGSHISVQTLQTEGKTLRLLCPGPLNTADFQRLLAFSEDFVACRGDQSFSEVVSNNKGFFYDPRDHERYFVQDLIALAENQIPAHRSTLGYLRLLTKVLEYNLPAEGGEWVDAISIQCDEPMDLLEISEKIGLYLQDPDALAGFKKLNRILSEEHSCNGFLLHLVQRAVCHRRSPEIAKLEEEQLGHFIHGRQPFLLLVSRLRAVLDNKSFL